MLIQLLWKLSSDSGSQCPSCVSFALGRAEAQGLPWGEERACCYSCRWGSSEWLHMPRLAFKVSIFHSSFGFLSRLSFSRWAKASELHPTETLQPPCFLPSSFLLLPTLCKEASLPFKLATQWGSVPGSLDRRNKGV